MKRTLLPGLGLVSAGKEGVVSHWSAACQSPGGHVVRLFAIPMVKKVHYRILF